MRYHNSQELYVQEFDKKITQGHYYYKHQERIHLRIVQSLVIRLFHHKYTIPNQPQSFLHWLSYRLIRQLGSHLNFDWEFKQKWLSKKRLGRINDAGVKGQRKNILLNDGAGKEIVHSVFMFDE